MLNMSKVNPVKESSVAPLSRSSPALRIIDGGPIYILSRSCWQCVIKAGAPSARLTDQQGLLYMIIDSGRWKGTFLKCFFWKCDERV